VSAWAALTSTRRPWAPFVGPFPHAGFLEAWWSHRGRGDLAVADDGSSSAAIVIHEGVATLAGDGDVTDYHSPLGAANGELAHGIIGLVPPGTRISFDSLPIEAAEPLAKDLERGGVDVTVEEHARAMVLHIGDGDYLESLDAKQRHEVRRKRRRFEEALGTAALVRDPALFATFVALHRSAPGAKGRFMTDAMAAFFSDLLEIPGACLDGIVTGSGSVVAAAFGFEDEEAYYLYNSAFDPSFADASPGVVLLHRLIRRASDEGRRRFDFLKGSEAYKRRLGAVSRPLYAIEGVV
jgi:CelD/BcsL family acetyltransferase involved in cellulose biosynthesis